MRQNVFKLTSVCSQISAERVTYKGYAVARYHLYKRMVKIYTIWSNKLSLCWHSKTILKYASPSSARGNKSPASYLTQLIFMHINLIIKTVCHIKTDDIFIKSYTKTNFIVVCTRQFFIAHIKLYNTLLSKKYRRRHLSIIFGIKSNPFYVKPIMALKWWSHLLYCWNVSVPSIAS